MEVFLHKICGQPVQPPVSMQLRRCTPEQAPAVYALQNEVRAAMPDPEQFVPDTLENITAYVRKDLCIGAWQGSRLGGYLIVRFCGRSAHNYAAFMDVPRTEWEHWANADSAIVHAYPDELGKIVMKLRILEGGVLELTVRDWGRGIDDIRQARQPLFTTGGQERSGMGFTIMESFMDRLTVKSAPGKGTTVSMRKRIAPRLSGRR